MRDLGVLGFWGFRVVGFRVTGFRGRHVKSLQPAQTALTYCNLVLSAIFDPAVGAETPAPQCGGYALG